MLTGKLVRVRHARNKLVPLYLPARDPTWLGVAEQLLFVYRDAAGRTRGELEEDLATLVGEGPGALTHQGLSKLLDDRCEYEVAADHPPDAVREAVFRAAATHRKAAASVGGKFDRAVALADAAAELKLDPEQADRALFADLKGEQRVLTFADCTPEFLVNRYNVALAQAILLRSVSMTVRVWGESPARFRQLFRAVKFHRLIATVAEAAGNSYTITVDGPMSLFSATQKYGLQLALFLPVVLHCKTFDLSADVRWGTDKKAKTFQLSATDGLISHAPDFGTYTPKEFDLFAASFRATVDDWELSDDPAPVPLADGVWVPDFTLTHRKTGRVVYLELFGFWRKADIESHYRRLKKQVPGKFVLAVSESMRADDGDEAAFGPEVYRYKRTPSAEAVARVIEAMGRG